MSTISALLHEPDPAIRRLVAAIMERRGCTVVESDRPSVLRRLLWGPTPLSITIVRLDGAGRILDLCRRARRRRPELEVVVIVEREDQAQTLDAEELSAALFAPFSTRDLCDVLAKRSGFARPGGRPSRS